MTEDHIIREVEQEYDDSETTEVSLPPCHVPREAAVLKLAVCLLRCLWMRWWSRWSQLDHVCLPLDAFVVSYVDLLVSVPSAHMSITGESELNSLNVDDLTANSRTPCNTPPEK